MNLENTLEFQFSSTHCHIKKKSLWDTVTLDSLNLEAEFYLAKYNQPLIPQRAPTGSNYRCVLSLLMIKERSQLLCQQLLIIQGWMIQFVDYLGLLAFPDFTDH